MLSIRRRLVIPSRQLNSRFGFETKVVGQKETPYSVLGVEENASIGACGVVTSKLMKNQISSQMSYVKTLSMGIVRAKYKDLVVIYHPDKLKNPTRKDTEKFHQIQQAYDEIVQSKKPPAKRSSSSRTYSSTHQEQQTQQQRTEYDRPIDEKNFKTLPYPQMIATLIGLYTFYAFMSIRNVLNPHGKSTFAESIVGLVKHLSGDKDYSWSSLEEMRKAKKILSNHANRKDLTGSNADVKFLGENVDTIKKEKIPDKTPTR